MTNHKLKIANPTGVKLLYQMMHDMHRLFTHIGLVYWIHSGTLLGAIRHKGMIPWDDDIDLCVDKKIYKLLPNITKKHHDLNIIFKTEKDYVKICFNDGLEINNPDWNINVKYTWPFIDLFTYEPGPSLHACGDFEDIKVRGEIKKYFNPFNGPCDSCFRFIKKNEIVFFHNTWKKEKFFPVKEVNFLGIKCNIPNNPNHFLTRNYGKDYMTVVESSRMIHKTDTIVENIIKTNYDNIRR
jgi:phosphorylcholine metabolism protein LicD